MLALGQDADLALLEGLDGIRTTDGVVEVDDARWTGREGVYAGGDATGGERTVTAAVGDGRRAARAIDDHLAGRPVAVAADRLPATADRLNTWYFDNAPQTLRPRSRRHAGRPRSTRSWRA